MDAGEITAWVSLVVTTVTPICGAIWKLGTKIAEKIDAAHECTLELKDEFLDFKNETMRDFRDLSDRVRKLETDVKEAIGASTQMKDILLRINALETKLRQ